MTDVYISGLDEILSPDEEVIHEQNKTIERLQEQLADADKLLLSLKHHAICDFDRIIYG